MILANINGSGFTNVELRSYKEQSPKNRLAWFVVLPEDSDALTETT
jgi:hypothetical protein